MLEHLSALLWLIPLLLLLGGAYLAYRRPPHITLERIHARHATEGQTIPVTLELRLVAYLPVRLILHDTPPRTLIPSHQLRWGGLFWGEHRETLERTVTLNQRGEYEWFEVDLEWADPFGIKWRREEREVRSRVLVFPGHHPLVTPELLRPLLSDGKTGARLGLEDPASLRGVREYQFGDALNRIHWRQTARTAFLEQPMVRELERVTSSSLQIHLDLHGPAPRPGERSPQQQFVDHAVRLSSSLIRQAEAEYLSFCVSTFEGKTTLGRGEGALIEGLTTLARAQPTPLDLHGIPLPAFGSNLIVLTQHPSLELLRAALQARASAARVLIVVMHEGFYLEPHERPRRIWAGLHESVRALEQQAAVLAEQGVRVFLLRGDQNVLELGGRG